MIKHYILLQKNALCIILMFIFMQCRIAHCEKSSIFALTSLSTQEISIDYWYIGKSIIKTSIKRLQINAYERIIKARLSKSRELLALHCKQYNGEARWSIYDLKKHYSYFLSEPSNWYIIDVRFLNNDLIMLTQSKSNENEFRSVKFSRYDCFTTLESTITRDFEGFHIFPGLKISGDVEDAINKTDIIATTIFSETHGGHLDDEYRFGFGYANNSLGSINLNSKEFVISIDMKGETNYKDNNMYAYFKKNKDYLLFIGPIRTDIIQIRLDNSFIYFTSKEGVIKVFNKKGELAGDFKASLIIDI
jgi:hypothetical protein